jgi:hypothetical protein
VPVHPAFNHAERVEESMFHTIRRWKQLHSQKANGFNCYLARNQKSPNPPKEKKEQPLIPLKYRGKAHCSLKDVFFSVALHGFIVAHKHGGDLQ